MSLVETGSIKAVIFDMDGLMLDTERVGLEAFRKTAADFGYSAIDEVYFRTIGRNWADTKQLFHDALGKEFPFDDIRARWRQYTEEHIRNFGVAYKTGLLELLELLQNRSLPMAVATSTRRKAAVALLDQVRLLHHFNAVVGGDETVNGKPHPEIFLTAAKRLHVDPKECVVFEDSAPGIRGAHAAGMIPILVPDLAAPPPDILQLAHRVFSSLEEARILFDGGAHPVMPVNINERFNMMVPYARAVNPITQTNWEGVGVKPHIEIEASQSLEKAKELARGEIQKRRGN